MLRWVRQGLGPATALGLGAGADHALRRLSASWNQAREAKVVTGSYAQAREFVLANLIPRGRRRTAERALSDEEKGDLLETVLTVLLGYLVTVQAKQDAAFLAALAQAFVNGGDVDAVATRFGADGIKGADLAQAWLYSQAVAPGFSYGEHSALTSPVAVAMHPYLEQLTYGDDKVRDNHRALHGFVARADWTGWERECLPPLGWNCRCRVVPVPWFVAKSLGYSGDFPRGTAKLSAFRALGGSDAGFPRELFVLAA